MLASVIGFSVIAKDCVKGFEMRWTELGFLKWPAALAAAWVLAGYQAGAVEEIVVYGVDPTPTSSQALKRDMRAYVEALNAEQKAKIDRVLIEWRDTEIQLAVRKIPTRG